MLAHHTHHPHLPSASVHTLSLHVLPLLTFWWAHLDDHIGLINLAVDFMELHPRHVDIFVFSRPVCSFVDILGHTRHWPSGLSQPTFSQVHPLATHQWEWEPQVIPHHWSLPPLSNARLIGCPAFPWWGPQLRPCPQSDYCSFCFLKPIPLVPIKVALQPQANLPSRVGVEWPLPFLLQRSPDYHIHTLYQTHASAKPEPMWANIYSSIAWGSNWICYTSIHPTTGLNAVQSLQKIILPTNCGAGGRNKPYRTACPLLVFDYKKEAY